MKKRDPAAAEERERKRAEKRERARRRHIVLCPHCKREVLDHMTECPFCHGVLVPVGYGGRDEKKFKKIRIIAYAVITVIAVVAVILLFTLK